MRFRKLIADSSLTNSLDTRVTIHGNDFHRALPGILKDIQDRQRRNGRSVFILDQYGWSQVNLDAVKQIFTELPYAEVFLTWMIDNLINFLSEQMIDKLNPALQRTGLGKAITAEQLLAIKQTGAGHDGDLAWRRAIQTLMTGQIRASSGAAFSTPFYIVPRNSRRGYWLLHLARHWRANEEMKRIHWGSNNLHHPGGAGFNMLGYLGNHGQLA
ncbi:three-Cys-motif partner protein TcmP, partial [Luteibacter mycovicinus]|uniref:three-Cys-motif partner protein TcmP n=1 Tax=Luteibacter mycovicinus TaxID=1500890 RepID=UPI0018CD5B47